MRPTNKFELILAALFIVCAFGEVGLAQQQPQSSDDVVRINTELVQTQVTVFEKKAIS